MKQSIKFNKATIHTERHHNQHPNIDALVDEFVAPKARDAVVSKLEEAANSYDSLGQFCSQVLINH